MMLKNRKADEKDIMELCILMEELSGHLISPDQMMKRLNFVKESPFDSMFVCEENGRIMSTLGFRIRENIEEASPSRFGEISVIVVHPEDRRRGVGRSMMDYAEKLTGEMGCKSTWLVSGFGREAARIIHGFMRDDMCRFKKEGVTFSVHWGNGKIMTPELLDVLLDDMRVGQDGTVEALQTRKAVREYCLNLIDGWSKIVPDPAEGYTMGQMNMIALAFCDGYEAAHIKSSVIS